MKLVLQRSTTISFLLLLVCATGAQGEELAQPTTLAAAAPAMHDARVKPVACCEGESCSSCCEPICCPKCFTEEVEKSCWLVKSELVCIPSFRWPWECRKDGCNCGGEVGDGCACPPKCGRVRCVNVLEEHKYTCEECGYEWEVKCVRRDNNCDSCASPALASRSSSAPRTAQKGSTLLEWLGLK